MGGMLKGISQKGERGTTDFADFADEDLVLAIRVNGLPPSSQISVNSLASSAHTPSGASRR